MFSTIGKAANEDTVSFGLSRYESNGAPNGGFSFDGRMRFIGKSSVLGPIWSISCRTDGSVIVGLYEYINDTIGTSTRLYRIDANGELDGSFGTNGSLLIDTAYRFTEASAIYSLPDGRIAVAGEVSSQNLASRIFVAMADGNGIIQNSFGTGGYTYFIVDQDPTTDESISAVTSDAQGRLLLAGSIMVAPNNRDMALWRVLPNGNFDGNFSADGLTTTHFDVGGEHQDSAEWILIRRNGRILTGGYSTGAATFISMAQFLPDGQLDNNGFGSGGGRATDFVVWNGGDMVGSLDATLMESGAVIVAGLAGVTGTQEAAMMAARFDAKGNRDTQFADNGFFLQPFPNGQHNTAMANSVVAHLKNYVVTGYSTTDDLLDPNSTAADITLVGLERDEIFVDAYEGLGPLH